MDQATPEICIIPWAKRYGVSRDGIVWTRCVPGYPNRMGEWRPLKQGPGGGRRRYLQVGIRTNERQLRSSLVHLFVLEMFAGPKPPGMQARHLDGDPHNNRIDNLEWGTPSENAGDKELHGTMYSGARHHSTKFDDEMVCLIRDEYATGEFTQVDLAKKYDISLAALHNIVRRRTWKYVEQEFEPMPGTGTLTSGSPPIADYTPGPWKADKREGSVVVRGRVDKPAIKQRRICRMLNSKNNDSRIIETAPDAHQIVVELNAWFEAGCGGPHPDSLFDDERSWKQVVAEYMAKLRTISPDGELRTFK